MILSSTFRPSVTEGNHTAPPELNIILFALLLYAPLENKTRASSPTYSILKSQKGKKVELLIPITVR